MSVPTISDVARSAGVGKTSVSRFLNGETDALSPDLRTRIASAIAALDYRPNQMARGLKRGRTRLIGVLLADLQNPFSVALIQGIESACRACGLMPMFCNAANEIELENRYLDLLRTYHAEGLLVNPVGLPESALRSVVQGDIPVVLLDRKVDGVACDSVGLDNVRASEMLVAHLASAGFDSLTFVSEPWERVSPRREREAEVMASARRHGLKATSWPIDREDPLTVEVALDHAVALAAHERTAVVSANGQTMLAVATALATRRESRKGADGATTADSAVLASLGLASFDDPDWAELVSPGITTLRQPTFEMGAHALHLLDDRLDALARDRQTHSGTTARLRGETAGNKRPPAFSPLQSASGEPRNLEFEAELVIRSSTVLFSAA